MRLTIILLTIGFLHVHASGFSQNVTFSCKDVPLKEVFTVIEKQTGYVVFYKKSLLEHASPVSVSVNNMALADFMALLLKDQALNFRIGEKTIMLFPGAAKPLRIEPLKFPLSGQVLDKEGNPLPGATIKRKGSGTGVLTDENGRYTVDASPGDIFIVSFIGYTEMSIQVKDDNTAMMSNTLQPGTVENGMNGVTIRLFPAESKLNEVSVVSTGYQTLTKERATGSFVQIDHELLNRSVTTDVLGRLRDLVPGLNFDQRAITGTRNQTGIFIRGQSAITTSTDPLIIIDNFPYDGDLNNINPNDVAAVSILKDAAATSIWGARAGNGVIVITTKKGKYGQRPVLSLNANITAAEKPDLYYLPKFSSADYIDMEKNLFQQGYYNSMESSMNRPALTPVIELLIKKRDGLIDPAIADSQIEALKKYDVRTDYERYLLRNSLKQQYALNLSGGTAAQRYFLSAGYDRNLDGNIGNSYDRITLNASNNYSFFDQKLDVSAGIYFTSGKTVVMQTGISELDAVNTNRLYPYARLADENGNALPINKYYRQAYVDTAGKGKLLDWKYRPLDELRFGDNSIAQTDYRVNAAVKYKVLPFLHAEILYQYNGGSNNTRDIQSVNSYEVRDMINKFSVIRPDGSVTRPVPLGGIQDLVDMSYAAHNFRSQLSFNRTWAANEVTALAGWEVRDKHSAEYSNRNYGYDERFGTTQSVSYTTPYTLYHNNTSTYNIIPRRGSERDLTDRFRSYYVNASYTWQNRYLLYASGRIDQSNLFGVKTNQKSVPLWSAGIGWNIHEEAFFKAEWLTQLKLRGSYGFSGNVDKTLSAYTTASFSGDNGYGFPYASIQSPPNPQLRWEQIGIANIGIDFTTRHNRISGTIELYEKQGIDLFGQTAVAPQTGIVSFRKNTATTKTRGMEVSLNTRNLTGGFTWNSALVFSFLGEKVTDYSVVATAPYILINSSSQNPRIGKPLYGVYAYRWAGLDPLTGDPLFYDGKEVSKDYTKVYNNTRPDDLIYYGAGRPTIYGALRNSFAYKGISLSASISYRLNYYVRKESVDYNSVLNGSGTHGDYYKRWQKPGDEAFTEIPSMPAANDLRRAELFAGSPALVSKGDHIRLQDLTAGYDLTRRTWKNMPFSKLQVYLYANNIGLLWKANKWGIDPDYLTTYTLPVPRTVSIGFKAEF